MIPFCLFKYIYFRGLIYYVSIVITLNISYNALKKYMPIIYNVITNRFISVILYIICTIFIITFVLNRVIFKTYKNIQITTNMKAIDWALVWDIILLELGIGAVNYVVILILQFITTEHIILRTVVYLLDGILYYFASNVLLNERIKVVKI